MTSDIKRDRKTTRGEDWLNYRSTRNRVTNKIKKAKQMYNRKLVEENSNDSKAFWKTVKKILPGESEAALSSINIDGDICTDNKKIANGFNKFFFIL